MDYHNSWQTLSTYLLLFVRWSSHQRRCHWCHCFPGRRLKVQMERYLINCENFEGTVGKVFMFIICAKNQCRTILLRWVHWKSWMLAELAVETFEGNIWGTPLLLESVSNLIQFPWNMLSICQNDWNSTNPMALAENNVWDERN